MKRYKKLYSETTRKLRESRQVSFYISGHDLATVERVVGSTRGVEIANVSEDRYASEVTLVGSNRDVILDAILGIDLQTGGIDNFVNKADERDFQKHRNEYYASMASSYGSDY
jgi:hypothetical protein